MSGSSHGEFFSGSRNPRDPEVIELFKKLVGADMLPLALMSGPCSCQSPADIQSKQLGKSDG